VTIAEIKGRLYHHANLPSESPPSDSLCFLLFSSEGNPKPANLIGAFRDVLECLAELNKIWNGPIPSATTKGNALRQLDRQIVYSVNVIIADAAGYALRRASASNIVAEELQAIVQLAYALSCAWDAVLSGDIDDLGEAVRLEVEAKAPGKPNILMPSL